MSGVGIKRAKAHVQKVRKLFNNLNDKIEFEGKIYPKQDAYFFAKNNTMRGDLWPNFHDHEAVEARLLEVDGQEKFDRRWGSTATLTKFTHVSVPGVQASTLSQN